MGDIAVTAISPGASITRLQTMDFAYAPPFSTAIYPITAAANILRNKISGRLEPITPKELAEHLADDYRVINVSVLPEIPDADSLDLTKVNGIQWMRNFCWFAPEENGVFIAKQAEMLRLPEYQSAGGRPDL
ncbi:MAG: hypothetical protein LKJ17_11980 [Oscillospiraceae bacterium]|nr:hypothetical protein [Oscillospiraceae bacterium]